MFADLLSEPSWGNRSHRGWTTIASFAAESVIVGILLILPLVYTQVLPSLRFVSRDPLAPPSGTLQEVSRPPQTHVVTSNVANDGSLIAPPTIPRTIDRLQESVPPPIALFGSGLLVQGSTGQRGVLNPIFESLGTGTSMVSPPPATPVRRPVTSSIMEGNLIRRVQPGCPPLARRAGIQGSVLLRAIISKEGTIENLQVTSGHRWLAPAAVEAVRQWRYRPYYLNGQPIEVETQITVNFTLSGG